ncbi:MAG: hypothetical protein M0P99_08690 [Candidatus Cloacimonetes bacterium]|nr:hypothetical protein [Candidatus Cloacimonadota bacterium]
MIKNDGWRKIKYAIVQEIELNENMSDIEIERYLANEADGKEFIWCDADEEIFSE